MFPPTVQKHACRQIAYAKMLQGVKECVNLCVHWTGLLSGLSSTSSCPVFSGTGLGLIASLIRTQKTNGRMHEKSKGELNVNVNVKTVCSLTKQSIINRTL